MFRAYEPGREGYVTLVANYLPLQDAYGGHERINVPATVGPQNWGYRMPWAVEELGGGVSAEVGERLRSLALRHRRASGVACPA